MMLSAPDAVTPGEEISDEFVIGFINVTTCTEFAEREEPALARRQKFWYSSAVNTDKAVALCVFQLGTHAQVPGDPACAHGLRGEGCAASVPLA